MNKTDEMTPKYKQFLEQKLSVRERAIVVRMVGAMAHGRYSFTTKNMRDKVRVLQDNYFSAVLIKLVKKDVLTRVARGAYMFNDTNLVDYIRVRCLKQEAK